MESSLCAAVMTLCVLYEAGFVPRQLGFRGSVVYETTVILLARSENGYRFLSATCQPCAMRCRGLVRLAALLYSV